MSLSPWRLLGGYLRTYRRTIALCLLIPAAFLAMHLIGLGTIREIGYSLLLVAFGLFFVWVASFSHYVGRLLHLNDALRNLLPSAESVPAGDGEIERLYRALAVGYQQRQNDALAAAAAEERERVDYYTLWVHQIKTPIAAIDLLAQSDEPVDKGLLRQELFKIGQYADVALSYQRMRSLHADLEVESVPLYPLCCSVVRKLRTLFLYRRIALRMEPFEGAALSDAKWLGLVLTQVLTNALKYTPEGGNITIAQPEPCVLTIADTGIGIRPEDIPRVFDRGFTGQIGRSSEKSTGIGLYLCREVCGMLGHHIVLSSVKGEGTTVRLDLRRERYDAFS